MTIKIGGSNKRIGLALSGGGFRAAAFHLGVMRKLQALGLLDRLDLFSCVSGGSIAGAFVAANWRKPDKLAASYDRDLFHDATLKDLADGPRLYLNSTNLATGNMFFFVTGGGLPSEMGEHELGVVPAPDFKVSRAVAASSAFPPVFPPLRLDAQTYPHATSVEYVTLTDGGVYDNMGLEPAWKTHAVVLVSDGGTPFRILDRVRTWIVPRLLRSFQVVANQALAVRKRWLIAAYLRAVYRGAYWGLGTDRDEYQAPGAARPLGYSGPVLDRLRVVRTDLDRFLPGEQAVLINHGWALAGAAMNRWAADLIAPSVPERPPDPSLLDPDAALAALAQSDRFRLLGH